MLQILRQPFPSEKKTKYAVRMCIMASICVWAVFYFIKPFGLGLATDTMAAVTGLKFALVTLVLSLFCTIVVPFLFPALFDEKHWTVLMEIIFLLSMVLCIAVGNVWLTTWLFGNPLSAGLVLSTIKYTLVIGSAPVLLSVLVKQQRLLAKYSKEARQMDENISIDGMVAVEAITTEANGVTVAMNRSMQPTPVAAAELYIEPLQLVNTTAPDVQQLQLKGENQAESLLLAAGDFLFAEAADNYCSIHYLENGLVKQALFRATMKNLEAQTATAASIFRCHKSYLVNLQQVQHISGNAQGYKLHLQQNSFALPVSRSLNSQIKQKMQDLHPKK